MSRWWPKAKTHSDLEFLSCSTHLISFLLLFWFPRAIVFGRQTPLSSWGGGKETLSIYFMLSLQDASYRTVSKEPCFQNVQAGVPFIKSTEITCPKIDKLQATSRAGKTLHCGISKVSWLDWMHKEENHMVLGLFFKQVNN